MNSPQLILITDTSRYSGETFFNTVKAALRAGVNAVLVREKEMSSSQLLAFSSRLRQLTHRYRARLLIHSQADVALAVDADGVHLSSSDIHTTAAVRGWLNDSSKTVSVSCHDIDQLRLAEGVGADFVFLSPVFPTLSHPGAASLGVEGFFSLASQSELPVVALGGISDENRALLEGFGVAVISAILASEEPAEVAKRLSE